MARRPGRLLLAAALCCLAAAARADTYTVVWGPEDLLRALALAAASPFNQSVIELPRDVSLEPSAAAAYELPLRLKGRVALRRAQEAETVNMHLGGVAQLLFLDRGAQLELSNLSVSGIAAADAQQLSGLPTQAQALVLFPTVNAEPGAAVKLHNLRLALPASERCSAHAAGQPLGAAPVVDAADGAAVGEVLVEADGLSFSCEGSPASSPSTAPAPSASSGSEGSSGGTPAWVWAVVAVAAVAGIGAAVGGVFIWRRRRAAAAAAATSGLESRSSSEEIDKKLSSGNSNISIAVFTPRQL
ncbi:hypothetical protein COHA_004263 [Chlorella ohadii]|uniref:Uncharacterized protein n=1 Tax=Chlorella ohadii TaxID=2649997 RepID=A0AAD5DQE7_9CHLO|nr:hypothetical protein COHA_004263 [Chlorella ohadii]